MLPLTKKEKKLYCKQTFCQISRKKFSDYNNEGKEFEITTQENIEAVHIVFVT